MKIRAITCGISLTEEDLITELQQGGNKSLTDKLKYANMELIKCADGLKVAGYEVIRSSYHEKF